MNSRVLAKRTAHGWSQMKLALEANITQADVSRIEYQGWIPPQEIQERLAKALGVTPAELFAPEARYRP